VEQRAREAEELYLKAEKTRKDTRDKMRQMAQDTQAQVRALSSMLYKCASIT
jgi:hypothetical protein